jgi:hypothetical protein
MMEEPRIERDETVIDEVPSDRTVVDDNPVRREPIDDRTRWDRPQYAPGAPGPREVEAAPTDTDAGAVGGAVAGGAGGVIAGGAIAGPPGAVVGGALGAAAGALAGDAADDMGELPTEGDAR